MMIVLSVIVAAITVYLVYALLNPEKLCIKKSSKR